MKVKATMTFLGNHGENDDSGFWKKDVEQEVADNRARELIRNGVAVEVEEHGTPAAKPAAPKPNVPATTGSDKENK